MLPLFSIGSFSYSSSPLRAELSVGRYCSIAEQVAIYGADHPLERITTSPMTYDLQQLPFWRDALATLGRGRQWRTWTNTHCGEPATPQGPPRLPTVSIGHDVWIGQYARLRPGITIATGAVVGAGALVTRDVEPYAVVGGVPARLIRRRFADELCSDLLESQWWQYAFPDFAGLDLCDPRRFLEGLQQLQADGLIKPYEPQPLTTAALVRRCTAGDAPQR